MGIGIPECGARRGAPQRSAGARPRWRRAGAARRYTAPPMSQLTAVATPQRIALFRPGAAAPLLVQRAAPDRRPYLHPLRAPDGAGVLTEDAPAHHPWQHGLYTGLNDVNGAGFWMEGLRERDRETDGTFHPRPLAPPVVDGPAAAWSVVAEWRAPAAAGGAPLLEETQAWRFADGPPASPDGVVLDLDWTLRAAVDLTCGQYAYGGLFLRMPYRAGRGGAARSSEGGDAPAADGARARWMAVAMPIEGRPAARPEAGVAILSHPANPEFPPPWRVDRQLGVGPSRCVAGPWRLAAGAASSERYRLLVFAGPIDAARTEAAWQRFAAT